MVRWCAFPEVVDDGAYVEFNLDGRMAACFSAMSFNAAPSRNHFASRETDPCFELSCKSICGCIRDVLGMKFTGGRGTARAKFLFKFGAHST
eukprot:4312078-Amphidinium_carterae.1